MWFLQTISDAPATDCESPSSTASRAREAVGVQTGGTIGPVGGIATGVGAPNTGHGTSPSCPATHAFVPTLPEHAPLQSSPRCHQHQSPHTCGHPVNNQQNLPKQRGDATSTVETHSPKHHQLQMQFHQHCAKSLSHKLPCELSIIIYQ